MEQVKRVNEMEKILDNHREILEKFDSLLEDFEKNQEDYERLVDYYISENFKKDFEDSNNDKLPKDIKCGVLTEDAIFDLIGDNRYTAIRMLEVSTSILKNS